MKKVLSIILVLAYVAFAPVCFASTLTLVHQHEGGGSDTMAMMHSMCAQYPAGCATDPLLTVASHEKMYRSVTSAEVVFLIFFVLVLFVVMGGVQKPNRSAILLLQNIYRTKRVFNRHRSFAARIAQVSYRAWLAQLLLSPNLRFVTA